jgi:O-antigen ligase
MNMSSVDKEAAMTGSMDRQKPDWPLKETVNPLWSSRLIVVWLAGMAAFLPIKILNLPLNFELVDIWILAGMPVALFLYTIRQPRKISLSYVMPMWFVLISSFISAFASPSPLSSTIVIVKEIYLFIWFFVVLALLFQLSAADIRKVLRVWCWVVIGHGGLMIAQFLSPDVWELTNALGGNAARLEGYRAAGLFICDKAGCANKAAFFQLLGFVPLLLAGYSIRRTAILGIFLFASLMTSGSMGATLAFTAGLFVAIFVMAYFNNSLTVVIKYLMGVAIVLAIVGGGLYIAGRQSQDQQNHFERIIVGRYDKSSGGRFDLWGRGIAVLLEHNAFFWGVGPENFREVDPSGNDNQLHNDTLAFLVERGLLGLVGLGLFAVITLKKSIQTLQILRKDPKRAGPRVVVFLAALAAILVESLTHQIFHTREMWLVLAVLEAVLYKMITSEYGMEPVTQPTPEPLPSRAGLVRRPEAMING